MRYIVMGLGRLKITLWLLVVFVFGFSPVSFAETKSVLTDQEVTQFINTLNVIKKSYAEDLSDKQLLESAEKGMVDNLDPHSEYLDESSYKELISTTSGEFGGIGIEVTSQYGVLKVVSPLEGSPAEKAHIKSGDFIVALDGRALNQLSSEQAINMMHGKEGTQVTLTILRKDEKEPLKITVTRAIIHTDSVKSELLAPGYGYVHINQFQRATNDLLVAAITQMKKDSGGQLKGLILDLRNNPGGLLETAVSVANTFLDSDKALPFKKVIVYTEGRLANSEYHAFATGHDILQGAPLLILINEGSASASEIVAGALQDYHRAVIVGQTSFGKGSVQTIMPLDDTHAVKLTTALYHTPSGRLIQNQGISPDIIVTNLKMKVAEASDVTIDPVREFQLKDHISNQNNSADIESLQKKAMALAADDFQLYESLNILKTMTLTDRAH